MTQKRFTCLLALALALVVGGVANAQPNPDHVLSLGSASGAPGANVDVAVSYTNTSVDPIAGWSYGVAHDVAALSLVDAVDGATTAALNGGAGPDFDQINLLADGWTVGVVISFLGLETLAPGADYELAVATYTIDMPADSTSDLCFSSTLGDPPVSTVVVVSGQSVEPTQNCGTVSALAGPPPFSYTAGSADLLLGGSVTVNMSIADNLGASDTQGFSMGLGHDGTRVEATAVAAINDLADMNAGAGPDFFGDNLLADGWTLGVVYAFLGGVFLQFDTPLEVVAATYANIGGAEGDVVALEWTDTLGDPPVANVVVVDGQSEATGDNVSGALSLIDVPPLPTFLRGDANNDAIVNIADGIMIIGRIWYGYAASDCLAADDANSDGMVDTSDAIFIFDYRFLGGPAPAAPFPMCGEADEDCAVSPCAP